LGFFKVPLGQKFMTEADVFSCSPGPQKLCNRYRKGENMTKVSGADAYGYDRVGLTNLLAIGLGPSMAVTNSYLAHSQSLSILLTNSVQQQHQQAIVGLATTSQSITQLFGNIGTYAKKSSFTPTPMSAPAPEPPAPGPEVTSFHEIYKEPPYREPPYTE
jgi:hypothetical protein